MTHSPPLPPLELPKLSVPVVEIPNEVQNGAYKEIAICGDDCTNMTKYISACISQREKIRAFNQFD